MWHLIPCLSQRLSRYYTMNTRTTADALPETETTSLTNTAVLPTTRTRSLDETTSQANTAVLPTALSLDGTTSQANTAVLPTAQPMDATTSLANTAVLPQAQPMDATTSPPTAVLAQAQSMPNATTITTTRKRSWVERLLDKISIKKCPKPMVLLVHLSSDKHRHVDDLALKVDERLSSPRWSVEAMYTSDNYSTCVDLRLTPLCPDGRFTQIQLFVGLRDQGM